jgi:hypothetical protein
MPRKPKLKMSDIFETLRKEEGMTTDEEDDLEAEMIVKQADSDVKAEERKNVFMGKARSKFSKRR